MSRRSQTGHRRHCSRDPFDAPVLTSSVLSFDPSSAVHFRSPSRIAPDAVKPRLLNWTFTTAALDCRSSSRFAARSCPPAARGLLSSQAQLLLAHQMAQMARNGTKTGHKYQNIARIAARGILTADGRGMNADGKGSSTSTLRLIRDRPRPSAVQSIPGYNSHVTPCD